MSAYPSLGCSYESKATVDAGLQIDRADDGSVRARRFYAADTVTFDLVHDHVTATERDQILAHYAAHRAVTFAFTWPGNGFVYSSVLYAAAPQVQPLSGPYYRVSVTLTGR